MKKTLLIFSIIISVIVTNAQTFRVGFMLGAAITDVEGASGSGLTMFNKPGFTMSGLVSTKIGTATQMQMEITFIQKGSEVFPDSSHTNNYYDLNFNYLDISLSVRQPLHIRVNSKLSDKYGLIFGLTYGTLLSYSFTVQGIPYDIASQLNDFDASAFFGFYYNFTPNFFFDLRYSNSFIPAYKRDANANANGFYPYYNSWNAGDNMGFEIRLGYKFGSSADKGDATADPTAPTH